MKIEIIHAECWNGGAERVLFSLATALVEQGHQVRITTAWLDDYWREQPVSKNVCINLIDSPPMFQGDFYCGNMFIALKDIFSGPFSWFSKNKCPYDMVISDVSPSAHPLYRWMYGEKVKQVYYCHFPHQLMVPQSRNPVYGFYAFVMGLIEEYCLSYADRILPNSFFTTEKIHYCMPLIPSYKMAILYPAGENNCVSSVEVKEEETLQTMEAISEKLQVNGRPIIFSLNRYWPEKNLQLLVEAAGLYAKKQKVNGSKLPKMLIIFAGGIVFRFPESPAYYQWLKDLAKSVGIEKDTVFWVSPTEVERDALYRMSHTGIYS